MGHNKEDLKKLLAFISALTEQPGNEEFVAGLRALVGQPDEPGLKADLEDIRRILRIRGIQSIDYSFVNDEQTRNLLTMDNIRMEDCLLDNELSVEDKHYEFCSYVHFQVENVLNYYYTTAFSTLDLAQWHVEKYTKGALNPFTRKGELVSCAEISAYNKTFAFCAEFFPYIQGAPDYTQYTLNNIRVVRNAYVHRSKKDEDKIHKFLENTSFPAMRTTLAKLVDCVRTQLAMNAITHTVDGVVERRLPSAAVVRYGSRTAIIDGSAFLRYSSIFNQGAAISCIVKNDVLLDIMI